jgi:ketosteroid isomerase-like protein
MPGENVQTVRRLFEAFVNRDVEGAIAVMHPNVELVTPGTQTQVDRNDPYVGHEGVRGYFADVANAWEELEVFLHEYHEIDDRRVLVVGRVRARAKDGLRVDEPAHWAWTIDDEKIVAGRVFDDRHDALRAVGLDDSSVIRRGR